MQYFKLLVVLVLQVCFLTAQNTVGLTTIDRDEIEDGFYLIYPNAQSDVFLINQCGELVHSWNGTEGTSPGTNAYIAPNGNLYKSSNFNLGNTGFGAGGSGGLLEVFDWESNLIYRDTLSSAQIRQHHDIEILPNGNILCLVWEKFNLDEIESKGFKRDDLEISELWCDAVYEIDPVLDSIVWKWQSWNHLIQDVDDSLLNYANIKENSGKININYHEHNLGIPDWMHGNSLDYNEDLDQILISVRSFNEVWIIDHSTSAEEAGTNSGGNSNMGGQILFRWGNPAAYKAGDVSDRKFFSQHDAQWINDVLDSSDVNFNNIIVFNNNIPGNISLGQIIDPVFTVSSGYLKDSTLRYLPEEIFKSFSHPIPEHNFSSRASSVQYLDNGNILMCASRQGRSFEITYDERLVWEYITPMKNGVQVPQFTPLGLSDNFTFQLKKYRPSYKAFEGRDLSPKGFLELNPNPLNCGNTLSNNNIDKTQSEIAIRLVDRNTIEVSYNSEQVTSLNFEIFGLNGSKITSFTQTAPVQKHSFKGINSGYYVIVNKELKYSKLILVEH